MKRDFWEAIKEYLSKNNDDRKIYYYSKKDEYNKIKYFDEK